MRRSVSIHSGRGPRAEFISVHEALRQLNCEPPDTCVNTCKALGALVESSMPASAVDLIRNQAENIGACAGPEPKSFGRVACGAHLK